MINSLAEYLSARAQLVAERTALLQQKIALYGNPRLGPKAHEEGAAILAEMEDGLMPLREACGDYERGMSTARARAREATAAEPEQAADRGEDRGADQ